MSFILDALKKSEARRRMGETPGLESATPSMTPTPRRRLPVLLILSLLVVVLLALLLWREFGSGLVQRLTEHDRAQPDALAVAGEPETPRSEQSDRVVTRSLADQRGADRSPQPPVADSETADPATRNSDVDTRLIADESEARPEPEPVDRPPETAGEARESAAAADDAVEPAPAGTGRESRAGQDVEPAVGEPELRTEEPEPEQPFQPERPAWMEHWELPPDVRRDMPELELTVHVYAKQPAERFVLINTERYGEDDSVAEGVRLVEITREGAVLEYDDYRFLLRQ